GEERDAVWMPRPVVDDKGVRLLIEGEILDGHRSEFSDCRRLNLILPGGREHRFFVEIVSIEVVVELAEHGIAFEERCHTAIDGLYRKPCIDGVAEITRVSQKVAGRKCR